MLVRGVCGGDYLQFWFSVEQRDLCGNACIDALISITRCVGKVTEEPSVRVAVSQPEMRFTLSCLYACRAPRLSERCVGNLASKAWSVAGCKDRHLFSSLPWPLFSDVCEGVWVMGSVSIFFFPPRQGLFCFLLSSVFMKAEQKGNV